MRVRFVHKGPMQPRDFDIEEDHETTKEPELSCGRQPSAENSDSASGARETNDHQSVSVIADSAKSMDRH